MKQNIFLISTFFIFLSFSACKQQDSSSANPHSIKLGAIASLTGPAGDQGQGWLEGAQLAVEDLKKEGIQVELVVEDDGTEPRKVISALTKLVTLNKIQGLIGGTWDFLAEAAYPLALKYKIPLVIPSNPVELLSADKAQNPYIFFNSLSIRAEEEVIREFLKRKNIQSIGFVYPVYPFCTAHVEMVKRVVEVLGIKIVSEYQLPQGPQSGDAAKLAALKVKETNPELVYFPTDYSGLDLLTNELKRLGSSPIIFTTQHLEQAFDFSNDPIRYKNAYAAYPKLKSEDFLVRFKSYFKRNPKVFSEQGYDGVMFLAKALKAGADLSNPEEKFSYSGLVGEYQITPGTRQIVKDSAVIATTRNGVFERLLTPEEY